MEVVRTAVLGRNPNPGTVDRSNSDRRAELSSEHVSEFRGLVQQLSMQTPINY